MNNYGFMIMSGPIIKKSAVFNIFETLTSILPVPNPKTNNLIFYFFPLF